MGYLIDFTKLESSKRLYRGNAGLKRGVIYNKADWILKFPQSTAGFEGVDISYTTSPLSEFIGSHIYQILGYPVHETILGIHFSETSKQKRIVVACKDFIKEGETELVDYETIKNYYSDNLQDKLNALRADLPPYEKKDLSSHSTPIEEIILQFKENEIFKTRKDITGLFFDVLVIDYFINNNDRNPNNWGLIKDLNNNKFMVAPIFDNGASFVSKHSDEKLKNILSKKDVLYNAVINGVCHFTFNHKQMTFKNLFKELENTKIKDELHRAFDRVVPKIEKHWKEISDFINNIPNIDDGMKIISDFQKEYFIKSMKIRFDEVIKPLSLENSKDEPEVEEDEKEFEIE